jgi:ElaB/YqjD/DUF883 family membrane-anchored ribosome-binding protein
MEAVREQNRRESAADVRSRVAKQIEQERANQLQRLKDDEARAARASADRADQLKRQNPGR